MSFQRVFSLVAWKIEALAKASASLADTVALSKSPASAAFFAAASVFAVVVHWLRSLPASLLAASAAAYAALKSSSDPAASADTALAASSASTNADLRILFLMAAPPDPKSAAR